MESCQVRRDFASAGGSQSRSGGRTRDRGGLRVYAALYHWLAGMRDKLGMSGNQEGDLDLVRDLLRAMHENASDFTLTFRRLCAAAADEKADADVRGLFADPGAYDIWAARWRSRLAVDEREPNARAKAMRAVNPAFIPRNHRVENKRSMRRSSVETFRPLPTCYGARRPYEDQSGLRRICQPASNR